MEQQAPLPARSWEEVHYYLMATPCPACGKGPWSATPVTHTNAAGADVAAVCRACGQGQTFRFTGPTLAGRASRAPDYTQPVNPSDQPSRLIDLGQWLGLFHTFLEAASKEPSKPIARRLGYQAAQCLAEALKFYGEDELPSEKAFFVQTSREAFRGHPEYFARQRLRDMQAKLPPLQRMAERIEQDRRSADAARKLARRPWWKFWKR